MLFFFLTYVISAEYARPAPSRGEVLVFRRRTLSSAANRHLRDEEHQPTKHPLPEKPSSFSLQLERAGSGRLSPSECGKSVFHWEDVCYDINIKRNNRRILDHVDGWVQPGVTTVLMVRDRQRNEPGRANRVCRARLEQEKLRS